jgi:dihydrofolate reductase
MIKSLTEMQFPKKLIGLMATTLDGVIGYNNSLPWNYPQELEYFRNVTNHSVMIMGRKTYHSIPKELLIERNGIVLSSNKHLKLRDALVLNSLTECIDYIDTINNSKKIFMIGGAEIAALFLKNKLISTFILTKIKKNYFGDTFLDLSFFHNKEKELLEDNKDYAIYKYYL